jgi:uncharacterized membrane protein YozB (DUF420 family)
VARAPGVVIGVVSGLVLLGVGVLMLGGPSATARPAYDVSALPAVNAALNATSAVLLVAGFACIRRRNIGAHRACMIAAFAVSTLFLVSYLVYHAQVGSRPFTGQGPIRTLYFTILISHTILAIVIVPLVLLTVRRALTGQFARHARLARWTLPLWLYVSVTGVVVYWMLYRIEW